MKESSKLSYFRGAGLHVTIALFLVFCSSLALDQFSKAHMHSTHLLWEDPTSDDDFMGKRTKLFGFGVKNPTQGELPLYFGFGYHYSRNKGAAFSMLSDLDDAIRIPLFYAITLAAVVMITFFLLATPVHHYFTRFGLVMILSGAIGNFLDRVFRGYVIDFFDADWNFFGWKHDFAIFNVADIAINVGVVCLLIDLILHRHEKR